MMAVLQNALYYLAPFLLVITVIVVVHELGHFFVARAFGVAIDKFSIGFGRAVASWKDRSGVEWRIGWLPLGGYVRFAGDENAASVPDQDDLAAMRAAIIAREGVGAEKRHLAFKPLWQRSLVVLAGPAANFLLAIVLFAFVFGAFGEPISSTRVDSVVATGAAARAGFLPGDEVMRADGRPMRSFEDVQLYVASRAGTAIDFTVQRDGRPLHLTALPSTDQQVSPFGGKQRVGRLGLEARVVWRRYGPIGALVRGAGETWDVTGLTLSYLGRVVSGKVGADQLASFIGIAHASGSITKQAVAVAHQEGVNWVIVVAHALIGLTALMSVSVGLLNLLPIPTLDGGHLLFYAYESVLRRPPRASVQAAGYRAGLALLVGLMLFATWNDLQRLRVFHFLGSLFS